VTVAAAWIALALVALDGVATVTLVRSDAFTRPQKLLQAILVWLLPLFGAVGVLFFARYLASESRHLSWESDVPGPGPATTPSSVGSAVSSAIPHLPTIRGDS
jgi:hypothetical protein